MPAIRFTRLVPRYSADPSLGEGDWSDLLTLAEELTQALETLDKMGADAPASPADTEASHLADHLRLVAALPDSGAVVLVPDARERALVKDLILAHRGTAVCDATPAYICPDAKCEHVAAAGRLANRVFLAPGYEPKSSPDFWQGCLEFNVQGGWWKPQAAESYRKRSRPAAWADAAPPEPAPKPEPVYASVKLSPLVGAANDRGPWHKPKVSPLDAASITVTSLFEPQNYSPYRLYAPLPLNCGGGLNRVFRSQEEADAGLPAFVQEVRKIVTQAAEREAA